MSKRCKDAHYLARFTPYGFPHRNGYLDSVDVAGRGIRTCSECGERLPLGPASDDDEWVRVEIRAAELANDSASHDVHVAAMWLANRISDCERDGWHMYFDGTEPTCGAEETGYLAAAIAAHEDTAEGGTE